MPDSQPFVPSSPTAACRSVLFECDTETSSVERHRGGACRSPTLQERRIRSRKALPLLVQVGHETNGLHAPSQPFALSTSPSSDLLYVAHEIRRGDSPQRSFVGCREWGISRRYRKLLGDMTKVEALEREVEKLTPEELAAFRDWFVEHDWQVWDRQIERDSEEGRLDKFAAEALAELERGETREI